MLRGPISQRALWRAQHAARSPRLATAHLSTTRTGLAQAYRAETETQPLRGTVVEQGPQIPAYDDAFEAIIADVSQGHVGRLPRGKLSKERIREITAAHQAEEAARRLGGAVEAVKTDEGSGREERLSPAAILGTKRIGMVTLPEPLIDGIQETISGMCACVAALTLALDTPKFVREAFLDLLEKPKFKDRAAAKNSQTHSIAKASAFLPGQYAAVYNVLFELRQRIGEDKLAEATFLEVSSALAPGLWATAEVFGRDSTAAYTLVHKTRHGLDLIRKLSESYLPTSEVINYLRDPNQIHGYGPTVTMSTFHLTTLPKVAGRQTHLLNLLETGAEHIVLVDKASPEGWAAMSEAREFLLKQASVDAPLHITAPCPHENACPLVGGREACIFSQRLQRPKFLRKTKHAPRGEEAMSYTYLIVSRGQRPAAVAADVAVGRVGGVGRAEVARLAAKAVGHTELREVEGGGEFEMVSVPGDQAALAAASAAADASPELGDAKDEMDAALRTEAHGWPRLVALPLKRSGHVVIDACMPNGNLERLTVARSHGKQTYYDARKTNWGDLWPHKIKGKTVVRDRGIRLLSKEKEVEVSSIDQLLKATEGAGATGINEEMEASKEAEIYDADKEEGVFAEAEAAVAEEDEKPMSDAELDKLLASVGADRVVGGLVESPDDPNTPEFDMMDMFETAEETTPAPRTRGRIRPGRMGRTARPTVPPPTAPTSGPGQKREMSARPAESTGRPKVTVSTLQKLHDANTPITMLTAYDYPTALVSSRAGIDILLIGDSMAQVALGHHTTVPLTLDDMIYHTRAVVRAASAASGGSGVPGAGGPFILADMPFGYAESSVRDGVLAAVRLLKEGGADGVKIEGGRELLPLVQRLTESGVPVMPHIGLQPQRAAATGYKVQAKSASAAADLLETALELQEAGAFGLLLEAIPHPVATAIARRVAIPTIGIGAGPHTSGQVLVLTDMLGTYDMRPTPPEEADEPEAHSVGALENGLAGDALPRPGSRHGADVGVIPPAGEVAPPKAPKFVRQFGAVGLETRRAVDAYIREVRARSFPAIGKETYAMPKDQLEEFLRIIEEKKDDE
ncbi:cell wall biogenesis and architecture protein [Vanrija albida]|uniref:3-methyl-2-oxobutanoate hydroxymethyltransferase n=1 Tax=Vanrija albida TaxID=181172 RepID=A0ABR3QB37_9TREE